VRIVIPPLGNEFITLLKTTSLATVISLKELLTASQEFYATNFSYQEAFTAAALYYLFIVSILMILQSRLERRFTFSSSRRRVRMLARDAR
jgi:ABC-type amino acid transport system permease subunit